MEQQNISEIINKLNTPEGKQLLSLMKKDGGAAFSKAAAAVQSGDYSNAQKFLAPLLENTEAADLARKIGETNG